MYSPKTRHVIVVFLSLGLTLYAVRLMNYSAATKIAIAIGVFFASWVLLAIASGIILGLLGYYTKHTLDPTQGDVEQTYENAIVVITAKLFETLQPETLARAAGYYILSVVPSDDPTRQCMDTNHDKVEASAKSVVLSDPDFRDLVAATATVGYAVHQARGRVDVAERMRKSWAFSLSARPDHVTADGFTALVDQWGRNSGFIEGRVQMGG